MPGSMRARMPLHTQSEAMRKRKRLETMIDRHHGAVYRHALWLVGESEAASDLVQETYYEAWKSLCRYGLPREDLPWLLAILRRQAAKVYAARKARPESFSPGLVESLVGPEHDLDAMLDLARGLEALPLHQRDLLLLYALHGFSYQEIALQLDVPLGTVMSRLARARRSLVQHMNRAPEEPDTNVVPLIRDAGAGG